MRYRSIYIPLTFSEVFPNERIYDHLDMLQFRLRQISCRDALYLCAQLNHHVSRHESPLMSLSAQIPLLKLFLSDTEISNILQRVPIPQVNNVYKVEPTIFTRFQILDLIRHIVLLSSKSSKNPLKNNRSKKGFLSAALLVNDVLLEDTYGHLNDLTFAEMHIAMLEPLRQSARLATHALDFVRQFVRGATLFFEHMPDELPDFDEAFQHHTGLTLKEYYGCLFIVAGHYIFLSSSQNQVISKKLYCQDEKICRMMTRYMELESYSITELQQAFENQRNSHPLLPLRQRPILQLSEDTAIVLDPAFHTEKANTGPLFSVPQRREQSLNAFGYAFEKYAQDILHKLCINSNINLDDLRKNQHLGISRQFGEIDAAIVIVPTLLLFEIKGTWIKDNPRIELEYETYLDDLQKKYGNGARQLARSVNNLVNNPSQAQIYDLEITEIHQIFPVLITFDSSLILPGYTQYFEREFADEMLKSGAFQQANKIFQYRQWQVAPLAVMTVEVLELLEESVINFHLSDLLEDYANHRNQSIYDTEDVSLIEYIKWSKYRDLVLGSERMAQKALDSFEEMMRSILPDKLIEQMLTMDAEVEKQVNPP